MTQQLSIGTRWGGWGTASALQAKEWRIRFALVHGSTWGFCWYLTVFLKRFERDYHTEIRVIL